MSANVQPFKTRISGKEYIMVAGRVLMAHDDNDKLDIITDVVSATEAGIIVKAIVTTRKGTFTGHAMTRADAKGIAGQSPLEVAETSAVGRALGFAGYALEDGIASADEVNAAQEHAHQPTPIRQAPTPAATNGNTPAPANVHDLDFGPQYEPDEARKRLTAMMRESGLYRQDARAYCEQYAPDAATPDQIADADINRALAAFPAWYKQHTATARAAAR